MRKEPIYMKKRHSSMSTNISRFFAAILSAVALIVFVTGCVSVELPFFSSKPSINLDTGVKNMFTNAHVGEQIYFGMYENSVICWDVLAEKDDKLLLVTHDIIREAKYDETFDGTADWSESNCRNWMNKSFYESAFTDEEKKIIIKSTNKNTTWANSTRTPGDTLDYVFALSLDEVCTYYEADYARQAYDLYGRSCMWWLRTPGCGSNVVMFVDEYGSIDRDGGFVYNSYGGYRPAMWVDISEL